MSPSFPRFWPDRLRVSLAPGEVALARIRGTLRPRPLASKAVACDPAESWHGAVKALQETLREFSGEHLRATVVLSNQFARYAVVPYEPSIASPAEVIALGRHSLARTYGQEAKGWEVRVSRGPAGAASLACAIDAELAAALRACFPRSGRTRLVSIEPYLATAYNLSRRQLGTGAWIVLVERARACLACVSQHGWQAVQTLRVDPAEPRAWPDALEREHLRTPGAGSRSSLVHGVASAPTAPGWSFAPLSLAPAFACLPR